MKNNQKGFVNMVLIGVIVLLVAVGGYFAFIKNSKPIVQQPIPAPVVTQTNATTPTPTDETANWKTYSNLGFEVQYPSDWIVSENLPEGVNIHSNDLGFNVTYKIVYETSLKNKILTTNDFYKVAGPQIADNISVDGVMGKTWSGTTGHFTKAIEVIVQKPGDQKIYQIDMEYNVDSISPDEATLNKILSTFKFTK